MEKHMKIGLLSKEVILLSKRITIMIDDDLDKKLRHRQANVIKVTHQSHSFSKEINDTLRKALR